MFTKIRQGRHDNGRALVSTEQNRVSQRAYLGGFTSGHADPFYSQSPEEYRVER